jgi:hypothetical protein
MVGVQNFNLGFNFAAITSGPFEIRIFSFLRIQVVNICKMIPEILLEVCNSKHDIVNA